MLLSKQEESLSKFMSKMLRHTPEQFGLVLDHEGFCHIQELLSAIRSEVRWSNIQVEDITQVVRNCSKQRYEIVNDYIRANYGHSVDRLTYQESKPPSILYHGTNTKVVDTILSAGIKPMGRKYVHLSESLEFATLAGKRRGELVILEVDGEAAFANGVKFYVANHGVWLADLVPARYLSKSTME
ncbi:RNA 2'-phosphotransferase [Paenibacillus pectinilyticus]|uniref:Probable RNA 2'-phosphotransferase n=1 Tax=Paenibacillus pectinilyticus TaxID=512399 RepID=A0A1C0ZSQ1_9BACL|nr:RNA 2'-phosphotransferase [Paenibacillus pectinilyticus]OCT11087.1 RNA 2'-phosphotransferase [Paenibacillus pectinilyticus]